MENILKMQTFELNTGLKIEVKVVGSSLVIRPHGYGEYDVADGKGSPICLDHNDGKLNVQIAPNIKKDNALEISIEGAREILRVPIKG